MLKKYNIENKDLLLSASIFVGCLLIAVSIGWASGRIPVFGGGGGAIAQGNNQANQQVPGDNGAKVNVPARADAPNEGNGKVVIVEFSDFQCPFCQQFFNNAYKDVKAKYIDTGKVTFVYRHFPLPFHVNAQKAAEAGECANRQGRFFDYHDTLFTNGKSDGAGLDVASLKKYAQNLGLDTAKFNSCLDNGETAGVVKADMDVGQKAGVGGTPTFFINGVKVVGALPFADFQTAIEKALK